MYCLSFRTYNATEGRIEQSPGTTYLEEMGKPFAGVDRDSCRYMTTKEIPRISSYQPPVTRTKNADWVLANRQSRYIEGHEQKIDSSTSDEMERESRFQKELQQAHRNMSKKTRPAKHNVAITSASDSADDINGNVVNEREAMGIDSSLFEARDNNESKSQLRKENRKLKRDLKRTCMLLECERSQTNIVQGRIEILEKQVDAFRDNHDDKARSNRVLVNKLQKQAAQYQKELEEEQMKTQKLRRELEQAKRDNQKCKEQIGVLMFRNLPIASSEFEDIGACNSNIVESSDLIGDYELGAKLGEGHYGKVAVGTDLATKKKYAIKVLNKSKILRFKDLQQVTMEVHVLKRYIHPNIVHLHEVIHAPENLYIVTELCSMDLHKYHNNVGLSENGAQQVIFGVLKPLHYLHSHGICHLDLKPENILLAAHVDMKNVTYHDVRVCDFGLVSMAMNPSEGKDITRKGYACGTPGFFAPEMILENAFEGRQADMWSLGCIILEITLGFTQDWIDSYDQTESNPSGFRRGLENCLEEIAPEHYPRHKKLLDIIHGCLSIERMKRISSSEAMGHPWLQNIGKSDEGTQDVVGKQFLSNQEQSGLLPSKFWC